MPVDPQARAVLDAGRGAPAPGSVDEARAQYVASSARLVGPPEPVERVSDLDADGVPVRVYVPAGDAPLPAVLFLHGGGWILGTLDTHDALCRALCNACGAIVCSVDYRLAPEAQHPAAVDDASLALRWLLREGASLGVDVSRVAVAGDSAGGNLAAVLARRFRSDLRFQLLVYPVTDSGCETASYASYGGEEYGLSREQMAACWDAYAPGPQARLGADASPLRADDLEGLPPALVICAEYDPLTDEALAYAEKLRAAGVEARTSVYPGMVHGFFRWRAGVDAAHAAMDEAAGALREAFARG